MSSEDVERVIVTVDDQHLSNIQNVAAELRTAGLEIDGVRSTIGIITGKFDDRAGQYHQPALRGKPQLPID